jgi:hypothetical protein
MSKDIHRKILIVALVFVGCGGEPERSRQVKPSGNGNAGAPGREADAPPAKRNIPTH